MSGTAFILDTDQDTRNWRRPPQVLKIKGKMCRCSPENKHLFLGSFNFFILLLNIHIALISTI